MRGRLKMKVSIYFVLIFLNSVLTENLCDYKYLGLKQLKCISKSNNFHNLVKYFAKVDWKKIESALEIEIEKAEDNLQNSQSTDDSNTILSSLVLPVLMATQINSNFKFPDTVFTLVQKNSDSACLLLNDIIRCSANLIKYCDKNLEANIKVFTQFLPKQILGWKLKNSINSQRITSFVNHIRHDLSDMIPDKCLLGSETLVKSVTCLEKSAYSKQKDCLDDVSDKKIQKDITSRMSYGYLSFLLQLRLLPPNTKSCATYIEYSECINRWILSKCEDEFATSWANVYLPYIMQYSLKYVCL